MCPSELWVTSSPNAGAFSQASPSSACPYCLSLLTIPSWMFSFPSLLHYTMISWFSSSWFLIFPFPPEVGSSQVLLSSCGFSLLLCVGIFQIGVVLAPDSSAELQPFFSECLMDISHRCSWARVKTAKLNFISFGPFYFCWWYFHS